MHKLLTSLLLLASLAFSAPGDTVAVDTTAPVFKRVTATGKTYYDYQKIHAQAPNVLDFSRSGPLQSFGMGLTYMGLQVRPGTTPATATDAYIDNAAPYYDDATKLFYLLYVGVSQSGGSPGTESIHLAKASAPTGPWTKLGQIIQPSGVDGDPDKGGCTGASEPVVGADGLYYVYYIGTDTMGYEQGNKSICLATAPAITGPYTKRGRKLAGYGTTSLTPGAIWHRSIVRADNGSWHMFFNASAGAGEYILHATASGISGPWAIDTAHGITLDRTAHGWDSLYVGDPSIVRVGDIYLMSYWGGATAANADIGAGIAYTTSSAFPYGWTKLSAATPWFNSATFKSYQSQTLATKPRLLRVGAELYVYWSSNVNTIAGSTGSGIHLCRVTAPPKGVFPKSRNGQTAFGGPGYNEFGVQVGDYLPLGLADSTSVALVASTASNSYVVIGQAYNSNLLAYWNYNATPASAYAMFDTYGSTNDIRLGASMGTAGKAGIVIGSNTAANARSVLDLNSTAKGFRPPRMTTAQRDAVTWVAGDEGMVIWNTVTHTLQSWTGSAWQ